jgi:hypothetical protein
MAGRVRGEGHATEERKTAQAILSYMIKHPRATDTVEGIALWWIAPSRRERSMGEVQRAASYLVSRGLITETQRKGVLSYYKFNLRRRAAALRFLREL